MLELLHYLENARIEKCVATSTARDRAIHKLTLANIAHRFATITGGDQVAESKPNPEIFHIAAASCNTAPENCLVIEDSTAGAQAAKAAGMKLVIIPNVAYLSDETKATADYICKDLNEVIGLLE
jgi:HAD superfamily hydrolase (TIGR01509 family)